MSTDQRRHEALTALAVDVKANPLFWTVQHRNLPVVELQAELVFDPNAWDVRIYVIDQLQLFVLLSEWREPPAARRLTDPRR
jgi:hypothetical protein